MLFRDELEDVPSAKYKRALDKLLTGYDAPLLYCMYRQTDGRPRAAAGDRAGEQALCRRKWGAEAGQPRHRLCWRAARIEEGASVRTAPM